MTVTQIKKAKGSTTSGGSKGPAPIPQPRWQNPGIGLAKGKEAVTERTSEVGASTTSESSYEHTTDSAGQVDGHASESTHGAKAGVGTSSEYSSKKNDGKVQSEVTAETESFAGAEAAVKILRTSGKQEIKVAIETMARAGAFGKAEQAAAIKRGKFGASMSSSAEGGAGVEGQAVAMARVDRSGVIPALEATLEASIKAGLWVNGKFNAAANAGPLALAVCAEIDALLGVEAEVSARAFASLKEGIGGEFEASAFAGARFMAKAGAEIKLGPAALEVGGEINAMAGAEASASAGFTISLTGVSAKFEASAFAGAKASASGHAGLKIMGKKIIWAKGKVEVTAGAGGEAEGEFTIVNGKLKVSAGLSGALGLGMGAKVDAEVDFAALGMVICAQIGELSAGEPAISDKSPDYVREELTDPKAILKQTTIGYDAVYEDFLAYGNKKSLQGDNGVKLERVQSIIDAVAPLLRGDFAYRETDKGIEKAAMEAFSGQLKSIVVNAGKIRGFQTESGDAIAAHKAQMAQEEGWKAARDALKDDFDEYCAKKADKGTNGVKREVVQSIIDKHWKKVVAAFSETEADQVVMFAGEEMKSFFLDDFIVVGGKIRAFGTSAAKTKGVKDASKTLKEEGAKGAARGKAYSALESGLAAYRASLMAKKGTQVTLPDLQKVVAKAYKEASAEVRDATLDAGFASRIKSGLDGIVSSVDVKDGQAGRLAVNLMGVADSKGEEALGAFMGALESYKEQKTDGGKSGAKRKRVEELMTSSFKLAGPWLQSTEGSAAVEGAIQEGLGDWVKSVLVRDGRIVNLEFDAAKMADAKQDRKRDGKAVLSGGEAQDNSRRKMVADGVRAGFGAYIGELRAAADKDAASPKAKVEVVRLQKIVDKGVKQVRADVNNPVGDQALDDAIRAKFPMVTDVGVHGLRITRLQADAGFFSSAQARRGESAAVLRAVDDITMDLTAAKGGVTKKLVQMTIDKYTTALAGLPQDEQDQFLAMGVSKALGDRAKNLQISGGKVTGL